MNEVEQVKTRPRWQRWLIKSFRAVSYLLLITVVLGVMWIAWTNHRGDLAAIEANERVRASSIPAWDAEIETVPANENGAFLFRAAMESIATDVSGDEYLPEVGLVDWPRLGEGFTEEQAEYMRKAVERNRHVYELIGRASQFESFDYGISSVELVSSEMAVLGGARSLGRWLKLKLYVAQVDGDSEAAVESTLQMMKLARSNRSFDSHVGSLIQLSLEAILVRHVEALLSRSTLDASQLQRIDDELSDQIAGLDYAQGLQGEIHRLQVYLENPRWVAYMRDAMSLDAVRIIVREMFGQETEAGFLSEQWRLEIKRKCQTTYAIWCPGHSKLQWCKDINGLLDLLEQLEKPGITTSQIASVAESMIPQRQRRDVPLDFKANFARTIQSKLDAHSQLKQALMAVQLEKYRLMHGKFAENLTEVFDAVPDDAFEQPMGYVATDHGYCIYSMGRDGQDAVTSGEYENPFEDGLLKDDYLFFLVAEKHRNRAPTITTIEPPEDDYWSFDEEHASEPEGELPGPVYDADELFKEFEEDTKASKGDKPATE